MRRLRPSRWQGWDAAPGVWLQGLILSPKNSESLKPWACMPMWALTSQKGKPTPLPGELTTKLGHQACRWKLWAQEECMEWAWGSHSLGARWRGMDEAGRGVSLKAGGASARHRGAGRPVRRGEQQGWRRR